MLCALQSCVLQTKVVIKVACWLQLLAHMQCSPQFRFGPNIHGLGLCISSGIVHCRQHCGWGLPIMQCKGPFPCGLLASVGRTNQLPQPLSRKFLYCLGMSLNIVVLCQGGERVISVVDNQRNSAPEILIARWCCASRLGCCVDEPAALGVDTAAGAGVEGSVVD